MKHLRRSLLLGLACGFTGACFADFTLARGSIEELIFDVPGGTLELLRMRVRLADLRVRAAWSGDDEGPGDIEIDEAGPWIVDPLTIEAENDESPPSISLAPGPWSGIEFAVEARPGGDVPALELEARFRPDDGGATRDVYLLVDDPLPLDATRNGDSDYPEGLEVDLRERLSPACWFPNINVTNAELESDGRIVLSATQNAVVYGQVVDALSRDARDWFDPT